MKKLLVCFMLLAIPAMAEEVAIPNQEIDNTKSYTGINYNRQDSDQTGVQKIVNDHSWFNINVNIIKKGALFQKKDKEIIVGTEEEIIVGTEEEK